jgi:hypothetical protein
MDSTTPSRQVVVSALVGNQTSVFGNQTSVDFRPAKSKLTWLEIYLRPGSIVRTCFDVKSELKRGVIKNNIGNNSSENCTTVVETAEESEISEIVDELRNSVSLNVQSFNATQTNDAHNVINLKCVYC